MFIECPSTNDILCGKDKTYSKHPGNQVYRKLITSKASQYGKEVSKQVKMEVTKEIVRIMEEQHGARFLRKRNEVWEEISNQAARDKTSHALRFCHNSQKRTMKSLPKPAPQRQLSTTIRTHRRTVSNDSNVVPYNPYSRSYQFRRQQYQHYERQEPKVHNLTMIDDEPLPAETVSNSLHSAELEAILSEPLTDWEGLFTLSSS